LGKKENYGTYCPGVCNFPARPAAIYALDLSAAQDEVALRLLQIAVGERQREDQSGGLAESYRLETAQYD
jgi:hypothetical protein